MTSFCEWWEAEEVFMRAEGADDEIILGAMRSIAEMAWSSALEAVSISAGASCEQQLRPQWQPFETAPKDGRSFLIKVGATVLISRYSDEFLVVTGDLPKGEHKWYWAEIPEMVEEDEEGVGCPCPSHPQVNGGN